ncbi:RNA-directed DNA polymerase [Roseomonas marmotae]|uniref:RNA-directed DNA polymerase n=1 Tax=Roseomonas marmotae TaxID=2768161 RepID=A0ABS3KG33_9PROT|nr:RNA-directed DNA polymerase [Roseomonas marmotae]MBO1076434.1 RNA-directed DNA polymerase [Roseomonas marmotae]QTI79369.1 RNA-directed DNA polymerase [Roseomonas marmotae]
MLPKDEFSYRRVAWIDPFDAVKYLSLCIMLFEKIEACRIPKIDGVIHSHRMASVPGKLFDSDYGYNSFRQKSGEISNNYIGKWKISTDISNFFERIGNHPLENHLNDAGCEERYIKLVREVLLQWAGDRRSFGVPVGSDASRILCEAALIGVDNKLTEQGICFVRYVDDFRLFAESKAQGHEIMRVLSELLIEEGLSINPRKTNIVQILEGKEISDQIQDQLHPTHVSIDLNAKTEFTRRVVVSGRSSISRFYREPGKEAIKSLAKINLEEHIKELDNISGADKELIIRNLVKYFIYVNQDVEILYSILRSRLTSIFYIVDALMKDADRIEPEKKIKLRDGLADVIGFKHLSYSFKIPLLRLASHIEYQNPKLIYQVVDEHRTTDSIAFFREAICLGYQQLDRQRIKKLAVDVFPSATISIQRSIYYAILNYKKMTDEEKRPLMKNMKIQTNDYFIKKLQQD